MSELLLNQAHELMVQSSLPEAAELLRDIVRNPALGELHADAYQMLGDIIRADPSLGHDDECGLSCFKKALEVEPSHLWACIGVLQSFGKCFPDHQDRKAVTAAIEVLDERWDRLSDDIQNLVTQKRAFR